jgi:hypothetical protein
MGKKRRFVEKPESMALNRRSLNRWRMKQGRDCATFEMRSGIKIEKGARR